MKKDQVAPAPPMGWHSGACYGTGVNEAQLLSNAEYVEANLRDYGFEYIVCDIQWSEPHAGEAQWDPVPFARLTLDRYGRPQPAENRFPSAKRGQGFAPMAELIHAMGLKFGLQLMRGVPRLAVHKQMPVLGTDTTCDKIAATNDICSFNTDMYGVDYTKPGAQAYYHSLFKQYAQWGVDFVGVGDLCRTEGNPENLYCAEKELDMIRSAMDQSGREMVLSLTHGPAVLDKAWHMGKCANQWQIGEGIQDDWASIKAVFPYCEAWQRQAAVGCWPDCGVMPLGKIHVMGDGEGRFTNLNRQEQITMLTLWSMFRSPLFISSALKDNDEFTLSLLQNRRVLRLNRYSRNVRQIFRTENQAAFTSTDEDDGLYVALFNLSDETREISLGFHTLGVAGRFTVEEIWRHQNMGEAERGIWARIPAHGAALYLLRPI